MGLGLTGWLGGHPGVRGEPDRARAASQDADQLPGRVAAVADLEEDVLRRGVVVGDSERNRAVGQDQGRGAKKLPLDIEGDLRERTNAARRLVTIRRAARSTSAPIRMT